MSSLIHPEQSSHWYTRDGRPAYEVPKADGTMKKTTLADARKLDLVPSVTTILSVVAKPGLEAWKIENAIVAALTLPRQAGESDQAFARRVVTDSKEQVGNAMDVGTQIHQWIEDYIALPAIVKPAPIGYEATCASVREWIDDSLDAGTVEKAFASPLGYGGRIDWFGSLTNGRLAVVDWKTQFVKGPQPNFYETWDLQLAAYALAVFRDESEYDRISVVISANPENPGCWAKTWTDNGAYAAFNAARELWAYQHNYHTSKELF